MPRGFWDWGVNPAGVVTSPDTGAAELAARLGSIDKYERGGEVYDLEDFEHGLGRWVQTSVIATGEFLLVGDAVRSGGYAAAIRSSLGAGREAQLEHYSVTPSRSRLGVEASFGVLSDTSFAELRFATSKPSPVVSYYWGLRSDIQNGTLAYLNSAGNWITLASGINWTAVSVSYNVLKLVVNPTTGYYVRAIAAGQVFDLSAQLGRSGAGIIWPTTYTRLAHPSDGANNNWVYWDDVILTHNEP